MNTSEKRRLLKSPVMLFVLIVGVIFVVFPLGYVSGILTTICCRKKKVEETPNLHYECISPQDRGITVMENLCYVTRPKRIPELPSTRGN